MKFLAILAKNILAGFIIILVLLLIPILAALFYSAVSGIITLIVGAILLYTIVSYLNI